MRIWKLWQSSDFVGLTEIHDEDLDFLLDHMNGQPLLATWKPMAMQVDGESEGKPWGDMPNHSEFIINRKALDLLQPLMGEDVEALPLAFEPMEYYLLNVIAVLDAIDYSKAEYTRFASNGRIKNFTKYAFLPDRIEGHHIFKLVEFPKTRVFVSDLLKQAVREAGLTGFRFELVWDSERPELIEMPFFPENLE